MSHIKHILPIVLSGGAGSRLWPISRESHPKPFILLPDGESLLQKTYSRAANVTDYPIMTITSKDYYLKCKAEYEKKASLPMRYLLEPCAKNTGPAILLAAMKAMRDEGPDTILLILPADHLITPTHAFMSDCEKAIHLANQDHLVTFGIRPTYPETGYGYIECNPDHTVKRFVEKPTLNAATNFLTSDHFFWNSGLFCFKAGVILAAFANYQRKLYESASICFNTSMSKNKTGPVFMLDSPTFHQLDSISIDYAVMEKANNIAMVACHFNWQDIGSFEAYSKLFPCDPSGNAISGEVVARDSHHNFIHSENRVVATLGVQHLAIIDTPDALLIAHRDRTQEVKEVASALKTKAHPSYLTHRTVIRPWGSYTTLEEGETFKIKRIYVKPFASLSLQKHRFRSEHWVVVSGRAKVINGDKEYSLETNESTFVPINTPHRLSNPLETPLIIIEVQTGQYLEEDDIIRLDDAYGRHHEEREMI